MSHMVVFRNEKHLGHRKRKKEKKERKNLRDVVHKASLDCYALQQYRLVNYLTAHASMR